MKTRIFAALLAFLSISASAQEEENIDQYFENGITYDEFHFILKTEIISIIQGDLVLYGEFRISEVVTLEAGIGYLLPYYIGDFYEILTSESNKVTNIKNGYSFRIQPRLYYGREAPHGNFIAPQFQQRHYNTDFGVIIFRDYSLQWGANWIPGDFITLESAIGFGYRQRIAEENKSGSIIIPVNFKIGFRIF